MAGEIFRQESAERKRRKKIYKMLQYQPNVIIKTLKHKRYSLRTSDCAIFDKSRLGAFKLTNQF